MTQESLIARLRELSQESLPFPAQGSTSIRLRRLAEIGREDLTLAKLAEAHWDAVAILEEAGRKPVPDSIYAVWASEVQGKGLALTEEDDRLTLKGRKPFCSGLGLVDRALVTVSVPKPFLLDVDLREQPQGFEIDLTQWATTAFKLTSTGAIMFSNYLARPKNVVGDANFYLNRPGFWHGACGPAACWVGGAAALVDYARKSKRDDPHTLAHLGAMEAILWSMDAALERAGLEIDRLTGVDPMLRALKLRHIIEQGCTEILRRLSRAYGPYPLAMDSDFSRRYQELDLYLRQTHGERDLEMIGRKISTQVS